MTSPTKESTNANTTNYDRTANTAVSSYFAYPSDEEDLDDQFDYS